MGIKQWHLINSDKKASFFIFLALITIQILYVYVTPDFNYLFGMEYGNVAINLISGNGFSNPLPPGDTGSTAWVAPILVLIISGGFLIFGKTIAAFWLLSIIKFFTYSIIFYFLIKSLRLINVKINHILLIPIFLLYILFSPSDNFGSIHDFWLPQLLVISFIYNLIKFYSNNHKGNLLVLLLIIFITPLVNPIFALSFMCVIGLILFIFPLINAIKSKQNILVVIKGGLTLIGYFSVVFIFSLSIWTIRNYLVFNQFIPTKSNMWFEFYLANVVDTDGKLSQSALYKAHPIYNNELRVEMAKEGEVNWLNNYKALSDEYMLSERKDYKRKIWNRMVMAFFYTETDRDNIRCEKFDQFQLTDQQKLLENKFIIGQDWMTGYGFYNKETLLSDLAKSDINEKDLIANEWIKSKNIYIRNKYSIPNFIRGISFGIIPFISLLSLLFVFKMHKNPAVIISALIYIIYLLPYIVISHQIRYQRPLFVLQVFLVYLMVIKTIESLSPVIKRKKNIILSEVDEK